MKKYFALALCLLLSVGSVYGNSENDHTCQGNADCSTGGGNIGNITNTNSNTANGGTGGTGIGIGIGGNGGNGGSGGQGGEGGTSNATATNTNNNNSSSGGGNANSSVNLNNRAKIYSQSFSPANGQDSFQLGSMFFGGIGISTDTKATQLQQRAEIMSKFYDSGLLNKEQATSQSDDILIALKNETTTDKCLGIIPCGKRRTIWNLFKLV